MTVCDWSSSGEVVDRYEYKVLCLRTKVNDLLGRFKGENKFWDEWNSSEFECLKLVKVDVFKDVLDASYDKGE